MSDTPRTDRVLKNCNGWHHVPIELARELERELNVANQRIKRLEKENNELRSEEARLLNTKGELERRIKRLEEAGDKMEPWSERVGQEFWIKAKEAKL